MALGLMAGREQMADRPSYVRATGIADEICNGFQEKIYRRPFNLGEREDSEAFLEAGGHSDEGCYKVCGIAAEVAAARLIALRGELG